KVMQTRCMVQVPIPKGRDHILKAVVRSHIQPVPCEPVALAAQVGDNRRVLSQGISRPLTFAADHHAAVEVANLPWLRNALGMDETEVGFQWLALHNEAQPEDPLTGVIPEPQILLLDAPDILQKLGHPAAEI